MVIRSIVASNGSNDDAAAHASDEATTLQIAHELINAEHPINVESLLVRFLPFNMLYDAENQSKFNYIYKRRFFQDAIIAIFHDINLPMLKRIRSVEMFMNKCEFSHTKALFAAARLRSKNKKTSDCVCV